LQLQQQPVSTLSRVLEETRVIMAIVDNNLDIPVVVEVSAGYAMAVVGCRDPRAGIWGDIPELSISFVPVEELGLPKGIRQAFVVDLRINMTVGDKNVRPRVVVYVNKQSAPTEELRVAPETGLGSDIGKRPIMIVVVESRCVV